MDFWEAVGVKFQAIAYGRRRMHRARSGVLHLRSRRLLITNTRLFGRTSGSLLASQVLTTGASISSAFELGSLRTIIHCNLKVALEQIVARGGPHSQLGRGKGDERSPKFEVDYSHFAGDQKQNGPGSRVATCGSQVNSAVVVSCSRSGRPLQAVQAGMKCRRRGERTMDDR